jgi:hypothetical protein
MFSAFIACGVCAHLMPNQASNHFFPYEILG